MKKGDLCFFYHSNIGKEIVGIVEVIKTAFTEMDAYYTNKPPGGVAYRCSFRVTEAVHAIERIVDVLAKKLDRLQLQKFQIY